MKLDNLYGQLYKEGKGIDEEVLARVLDVDKAEIILDHYTMTRYLNIVKGQRSTSLRIPSWVWVNINSVDPQVYTQGWKDFFDAIKFHCEKEIGEIPEQEQMSIETKRGTIEI
jgi:hypothetical protein